MNCVAKVHISDQPKGGYFKYWGKNIENDSSLYINYLPMVNIS